MPSLIEIAPVILEKKIIKFREKNGFCLLFCNCLALKNGMAFNLNKLEYPLSKNALCKVWLKLALLFLRRKFSSMYFANFVIIFIWKTVWLFIWKKNKFKIFKFCQWIFVISLLSLLDKKALLFIWKKQTLSTMHKRMLWANYGWNRPCGSGEEDFYIITPR